MVRLRIDGRCREYQHIPPTYRRALVSRLKIMARLDIAERRKPQDGKIQFRLPTGRDIELRVAAMPVASGDEDVVLWILTTTLHAALATINELSRKIWTAEDPVEITQYGLRQVQVQPRIGFTFAAATLYRPKGCEVCQGLGYKGRVAVHELLVASDDIRHAIQSRARVTEIAALARQQGMTTLLQDGVLKVLGGLTDLTQVKAVADS